MEAFSESRSDVSESPTESVTWQLDWCDFGLHWVCTHLIGLKTNLTLNPPLRPPMILDLTKVLQMPSVSGCFNLSRL